MELLSQSKRITALIALLTGLAIPVAHACTVREIVQPKALVERAQAIYHVRADGYVVPLQRLKRGESPLVRFSVLGVIKGQSPRESLHFAGVLVQADDPNDQVVPYDFVRPAGRHGMCFATEYRRGAEYLMLIRGGTPYWSRLAPINEQVFGPRDPWLIWVKRQVRSISQVRPNNSFKPKPLRGSA